MDRDHVQRVYFIGIGGIGMSALARYFLHVGKDVAGYDKTPSPITKGLEEAGASVHYDDSMAKVPSEFMQKEGTLVIYTPAMPASHSEMAYFREHGYRLMKRSQVLGEVTRESRCLAVAGTHGKTTTSAILAHLLYEAGLPIMAFLGGIAENYGSNFLLEGTEFAVVEADEYDRSFLQLRPEIACITSMDADHLDIYGDGEALTDTFMEFAGLLKKDGILLVRKGLPVKGLTYGFEAGSDYHIQNVRIADGVYHFDLDTPSGMLTELRFGQPGRHNLLNATVALAMALQLEVTGKELKKGLESFRGVARRFSYKQRHGDMIFIDDYAHHPTEIDAVREAVHEMHPGKKVLAVFQPHLYSRTRDFASEFARSLSGFDQLILLPIYPAREEPLPGITSSWLLEQVENTNKALVEKENLLEEIKRRQPDVLLTIGAGDIGIEAERIKKELCDA